jgi:phosphate transport system ATP-binding protein
LHDINVEFDECSLTALIGPSGSGKSTLLRCFNRIFELHPKQYVDGEILLMGDNILSPEIDVNELRKEIGMVFQKPTPFPMSIFDNVAFAVKLHEKLNKADLADRVEQALKQAALWDEVKDKLHDAGTHLSGGQQQRLSIARTIAIRPKILLLDEPTSALDPISSAKVEELITQLNKEYTIIMVTHNLKQAQRISERTIFMSEGKIIESALTEELFSEPKQAKTKDYITDH